MRFACCIYKSSLVVIGLQLFKKIIQILHFPPNLTLDDSWPWYTFLTIYLGMCTSIHRAFNSTSPTTPQFLYLALIQPILEYGSITWYPLNITKTKKLKSTQWFPCRVILQSWKLSHEDLLESNPPSLSKLCDTAVLCHLYSFTHLCSSPNPFRPHPNLFFATSIVFPLTRLSAGWLFPNCLFAPTMWNYLLEDVTKCPSLPAFKTAVCHHLL